MGHRMGKLTGVILALSIIALAVLVPGSCSGPGVPVPAGQQGQSGASAYSQPDWWQPTAAKPIHWQWQIGQAFNPETDILPGVTVYDIDAFAASAETVKALHDMGCTVIGYISVGTFENYRPDAGDFPKSVIGKSTGWPDEDWLDIRGIGGSGNDGSWEPEPTDQSPAAILARIMEARLDMAKDKGFDAIEPDGMDACSNDTGFPLTYQDQLNYNEWIAYECHKRSLSVGLKGDIEQVYELEPFFDWTLNEQSYQYDNYSGLTAFTGDNKAVFEVEYGKSTPQAGVMNALHFNSMTRNLDLTAPGSSGYVRLPCIPDNVDRWPASCSTF